MKQINFLFFTGLAAAAFSSAVSLHAAEYTVSGTAEYRASSSMTDWKGTNSSIRGNITDHPAGGRICMDMSLWNSGNTKRDSHGRDMLEIAKFPEACFIPDSIAKRGSKTIIKGTMSLHGIKKIIEFSGDMTVKDHLITYKANAVILLSDFNLKAPSIMGVRVKNTVKVSIQTEWKK
ncbi:MAG: YceI family protein [Spirochaetia bacterium]|nr:YceI family protein [Spirochaetia bacterium]